MAIVKYSATTGKALKPGEKTTDALGNTYTEGKTFAPKRTGSGSNAEVLFDAKTGKLLDSGAKTTDAMGNTFTQGDKLDPTKLKLATPQVDPSQANIGLPGSPTPQTIDTGQPSPSTVDAGQGLPGAQPSPYQTAFQQTAQTGAQVPTTMGGALSTIQQSLPPQQEDMSLIDTALAEDKGWQSLMQMKEEYFNPEQQKASLMDTYNKLYKKSGLDQLDEEIIDAKTIIEGTEDDIRNEIEMAGGFGTDSQVQALALSRNKVLLKNFNNLVALRESKAEHLGTMMNLAEKDRAYADSQFDRMLNYDMQMLNYRDKFIQNARDQYNKYDPAQLYTLLSGNPRQLAFAEQIMGVGEGGLQKLATMPPSEEEKLDLEYKKGQIALQKSNLKTDEAQRANIYSQIEEREKADQPVGGLTTAQGKPMNGEQSKAYGFGTRTLQAGKVITELEQTFVSQPSTVKVFGMDLYPNMFKTQDAQKFEQAKRNFVNAVLRRESGAAISPTEFESAEKQYFPKVGDKSEVLEQKKQNRFLTIKNLLQESGLEVGDVSTLTLSPQGDLIRIID